MDYGCLTDAIVWAYLFDELGMPVECVNGGHRVSVTFSDLAALLPSVRCYQTIDQLGHNLYKLQCYFITHFLYVISDWGQHGLKRELFHEEFHFIVSNFEAVFRLADPELVGEFLQCLHHFGVTQESDPELWPLLLDGIAFLIDVELKNGAKGLWVQKGLSVYDRYHSSYCAAVGLVESSQFSYAQRQEEPPIPVAFRDPMIAHATDHLPAAYHQAKRQKKR